MSEMQNSRRPAEAGRHTTTAGRDEGSLPPRLAGWAVHLLTASGALVGMLALVSAIDHDYRRTFLWFVAATAIDAVDGWFARAARVKETVPHVDGAKLDDIVDYLTYVFVPAFVVWQAGIVPAAAAVPVAAAMLLSSLFGFSRTDAKTEDYFFTGFPSYWNIVVFYLMALGTSPIVNAGVLVVLAALVFVPIGYVYPSRTPVWQRPTVVFGSAWAASVLVMAWQWPAVNRTLLLLSLAYPVYYTALSLVLHARRRRS
jgi:phosphatidylcholine synthase